MGCHGGSVVEGSAQTLPEPFTLELRVLAGGSRSVYYVLDADGRLRFGGGSDARIRSATVDAGVLSQEQRMEVWRIVLENGLLESEGRLIVDHKGTRYEFNARAGSLRNSFQSEEGDLPGLHALDHYLFEVQSKLRYGAAP